MITTLRALALLVEDLDRLAAFVRPEDDQQNLLWCDDVVGKEVAIPLELDRVMIELLDGLGLSSAHNFERSLRSLSSTWLTWSLEGGMIPLRAQHFSLIPRTRFIRFDQYLT